MCVLIYFGDEFGATLTVHVLQWYKHGRPGLGHIKSELVVVSLSPDTMYILFLARGVDRSVFPSQTRLSPAPAFLRTATTSASVPSYLILLSA
jgi:hypothetical protein